MLFIGITSLRSSLEIMYTLEIDNFSDEEYNISYTESFRYKLIVNAELVFLFIFITNRTNITY